MRDKCKHIIAHYFNLGSRHTPRERQWRVGFARKLTLYVIQSSHRGVTRYIHCHLFGVWTWSSLWMVLYFCHYEFSCSQQRVGGMPRVLKKSPRMRSTQLLRSSRKKSLRSWRCVEKIFLVWIFLSWLPMYWIFFSFFSPGGEGGQPYERRTVTLAVNDMYHNSCWYYLFHKKILKYTYVRKYTSIIRRYYPQISVFVYHRPWVILHLSTYLS